MKVITKQQLKKITDDSVFMRSLEEWENDTVWNPGGQSFVLINNETYKVEGREAK